jgi:hypothetical protein
MAPIGSLEDGLLGEITKTSTEGSEVVIELRPASLGDAFVDLHLSLSEPLRLEPGAGARVARSTAESFPPVYLEIPDIPLYDGDGNFGTRNDQVRLTGSVGLDASIDIEVLKIGADLKRSSLVVTGTKEEEISVFAGVGKDLDARCYLWHRAKQPCSLLPGRAPRLRPIVIWAGYVPIVITPVLNGVAGVKGEVSTGLETSVSSTTTLKVGVIWEPDKTTLFADHEQDIDFTPLDPVLDASAKGYIGPQLDVLLYGMVGPWIIFDAYVEADIEMFRVPAWRLYWGLEANVGVTVPGVRNLELEGVLQYRKLIAEAEAPQCDTTPVGGNGTVLLTGGQLNGEPVGPANWTVTVSPGAPISGSVQLAALNRMGSNAVAPFGYTWTWGPRTSSIAGISGWIPTGASSWTIPVNLTAPSTPGTYFILFAFRGEFNLAQVMSVTNWSAGGPVWNDGNDLVDVSECLLRFAHNFGFVPSWNLRYSSSFAKVDQPAAPIRIVVE